MKYITQPPNSPDINILDLTFFNSLNKKPKKSNTVLATSSSCGRMFKNHLIYIQKKQLKQLMGICSPSITSVLPHDHVRTRIAAGEPVNIVKMSYVDYLLIKRRFDDYDFENH